MVTYPSDWKEIKIGDTGRVITGSTPSTSNKHYWGKEYTWITPTDIDDRVFMYSSERKLSKQGFEISRQLPPGSVLITCIASIGKNCILAGVGSCNQQINAIIPSEKYDSRYIYYLMNFSKDTLENLAGITATKILNKKTFEAIKFCVPELSEQQAIASVLSNFDEHIDDLSELIEKKKAIRDGALEDLINGETRLDGFRGDWNSCKINDVADFFDNLRIPVTKNQRMPGNTPYYGANGIQDYVSGYTHDGEFILIAEDGANDLLNYPITYASGKIWVNNHAHVLAGIKSVADTKFLSYLLKKVDYTAVLVGGTRAKLNGKTLKNIEITLPESISEQQAIAQVLSAMDEEIESLEVEKEKMLQIKEGAMDDLLTGRVRLKV